MWIKIIATALIAAIPSGSRSLQENVVGKHIGSLRAKMLIKPFAEALEKLYLAKISFERAVPYKTARDLRMSPISKIDEQTRKVTGRLCAGHSLESKRIEKVLRRSGGSEARALERTGELEGKRRTDKTLRQRVERRKTNEGAPSQGFV